MSLWELRNDQSLQPSAVLQGRIPGVNQSLLSGWISFRPIKILHA